MKNWLELTAEEARGFVTRRKSRVTRPIVPQPPDMVDGAVIYGMGSTVIWARPVEGGTRPIHEALCPLGGPGAVVCGFETWGVSEDRQLLYQATYDGPDGVEWRPGNRMPDRYCRISFQITTRLAVRLKTWLTEELAEQEGLPPVMQDTGGFTPWGEPCEVPCYTEGFIEFWEQTYGQFDLNPWVWTASVLVLAPKV